MSRAQSPGSLPTGPVRVAQVGIYVALAALAYFGNGHTVRLSSGANLLPGAIFGILAATFGGPWLGMAVSGVGALGTVAAFGHAWVVPIVVLEAGLIGVRARQGKTPVGSSLLYWMFCGSPVVIGIYSWHLGVRGEHLGMIWLADFCSSLVGAVVSHMVISLTPDRVLEWLESRKPQYSLREHIWVGALAFGMAPLLFLLRYAGGDLQAIREKEIQEQLLNVAEDFASHLEGTEPGEYRMAQVQRPESGWIVVSWQRREGKGGRETSEVRFRVDEWFRRRSHIRELSVYCFRPDGELLLSVPESRPPEYVSLLQPFARQRTGGATTLRLQSENPFRRPLQIAGKVERPAYGLVVVAAQPLEAGNAAGQLVREVSLRWISGSILMSLLFGAVFSLRLTQKLRRLIESMDTALRKNGALGECPAGASPEVQLLWNGFQQLQGRLEEALADQKKTAERATMAVREKSSFLAAISHEIRGPMARILGATTLLQAKNSSLPEDEGLQMIQRSGEHLMSILEDVTDYCTLEVERMAIRPSDFPLAVALAELLQWIETEARSKNIEVGLFVEPDVPYEVHTDRTRLTQVLYNLAQNAVKFTDRGSVRVEVRVVRQPEEAAARVVEFQIRDTGDGIPEEWQKEVFEPFFHRTRPLANPRSGSGLGLAIVQRLAQAMGGAVKLESQLGEGTTMTVRLPIGPERKSKEALREHFRAEAVFAMRPSMSREALVSQWKYLGLPYRMGWEEVAAPAGPAGMPLLVFVDPEDLEAERERLTRRSCGVGVRGIVAVESVPNAGWTPLPSEVNGVHIHRLRWPACVFQLPEAMQAILLSHGETKAQVEGAGPGPRQLVILAAEDNADSRTLLELALRRLGHVVVTVANGHEAVEALRTRRFDIVLLDIEMPVLDGLQALALIRSNSGTARLPVFALTAHTSEAQRAEFLAAGFTGHIAKPYTLETLSGALRSLGKRETKGGAAGVVDEDIFGQYADLLRGAGQGAGPMVSRILGEVKAWLGTTPESGKTEGVTAHSLAGSCSLIGARKLAGLLRELSEMERTRETSKWNAKLAEAAEALRETEGYFAGEGIPVARE